MRYAPYTERENNANSLLPEDYMSSGSAVIMRVYGALLTSGTGSLTLVMNAGMILNQLYLHICVATIVNIEPRVNNIAVYKRMHKKNYATKRLHIRTVESMPRCLNAV